MAQIIITWNNNENKFLLRDFDLHEWTYALLINFVLRNAYSKWKTQIWNYHINLFSISEYWMISVFTIFNAN